MTVYIDVLFASNLLMDYVTLLSAARLGGAFVPRARLVLAALVGAGYAVLAAMMPVCAALPVRILALAAICAIAFWGRAGFGRLCALYLLVAAAFAGLTMLLGMVTGNDVRMLGGYYFAISFRVLVVLAVMGYIFSGVLLRGDAQHGVVRQEVEQFQIGFGERTLTVSLLHDNGNHLVEPLSGKPVFVLGKQTVLPLFGTNKRYIAALTSQNASEILTKLPADLVKNFGLLPYQAVGTERGMLLYVRPDWVKRANGTCVECVIAISPENIAEAGYEGLCGVLA